MKLKPYTIVGYRDDIGNACDCCLGRIINVVEHVNAADSRQAMAYFRDDLDCDEDIYVIAIFEGHLLNLL